MGQCKADEEIVAAYRAYTKHLREQCKRLSRVEIERSAEYHYLAWRVLVTEYNAR